MHYIGINTIELKWLLLRYCKMILCVCFINYLSSVLMVVLYPFNIGRRVVETFFTALQVLHKYKYRLCTELLHTIVFGLQKGARD